MEVCQKQKVDVYRTISGRERAKMTDEQIIAGLKCCVRTPSYSRCTGRCPLWDYCNNENDDFDICEQALVLINRQNAEIERLKSRDEEFLLKNYAFDKYYDEHIRRAKSEAIKEFAERLKWKAHSHSCRYLGNTYAIQAIGIQDIDSLVKDMTEGE